MDHEMAYILLRDENPALIEAFMRDDAMTIPENRTDDKVNRPDRVGPVICDIRHVSVMLSGGKIQ
jgi:hypothetical protein